MARFEAGRDFPLNDEQWRVYHHLFHEGPLTGAELDDALKKADAHKRVSELERAGVVREAGHKVNERTGMKNVLWDVTEHLPVKGRPARLPPKPSREDVSRAVVQLVGIAVKSGQELPVEAVRLLDYVDARMGVQ
jgi:DNA-binding Lrp family transcriptional regulator